MYIYHAVISALSARVILINLNMIFYTHVEHSPIKINLHKVFYGNTHTAMNLNVHDTVKLGESYRLKPIQGKDWRILQTETTSR